MHEILLCYSKRTLRCLSFAFLQAPCHSHHMRLIATHCDNQPLAACNITSLQMTVPQHPYAPSLGTTCLGNQKSITMALTTVHATFTPSIAFFYYQLPIKESHAVMNLCQQTIAIAQQPFVKHFFTSSNNTACRGLIEIAWSFNSPLPPPMAMSNGKIQWIMLPDEPHSPITTLLLTALTVTCIESNSTSIF